MDENSIFTEICPMGHKNKTLRIRDKYSFVYIWRIVIILGISFVVFGFALYELESGLLDIIFSIVVQLAVFYYLYRVVGKDSLINEVGLKVHKNQIFPAIKVVIFNLSFAIPYALLFMPENYEGLILPGRFNIEFILMFLSICIIAPIVEEVFFRGYVWKVLEKKGWTNKWILIVTSFTFALIHFELIRIPILFVTGLLLAWSRVKYNNLGVSIIAHAINNGIAFISIASESLGG